MKKLLSFLKDEEGISSVEYALLLAFIAAGVALAAYTLGGAIKGKMEGAADEIKKPTP